jgi:hypothetical protein
MKSQQATIPVRTAGMYWYNHKIHLVSCNVDSGGKPEV